MWWKGRNEIQRRLGGNNEPIFKPSHLSPTARDVYFLRSDFAIVHSTHYGYFIAQIFYGLWLVPLGYLAYTSGLFPRALADVLIVGGACYILDLLVRFLAPELCGRIHVFVVIPRGHPAEVWTLGYLLLKGIRTPREIVGPIPIVPVPASA